MGFVVAEQNDSGTSCANEGEQFSQVYDGYPNSCCSGLTEWDTGMDTRKIVDGKCVETGALSGNPVGTCLNCGNRICEDIETICNCPTDCSENETETKNKTNNGIGQLIRRKVQAGVYTNEDGDQIRVKELAQNRFEFRFKEHSAETELRVEEETENNMTKLRVKLNNGRNAEIKIMPGVASTTALARLRLKLCNEKVNCSIELKEVGKENKARLVYEVRAKKTFRILGFINNREEIRTQVDAETGDVVETKRPWWAWMASERGE